MRSVLITGGGGFIGSHLADELLAHGHRVRVLDSLVGQVHEDGRPAYLSAEVELVHGDVRDPDAVGLALEGVDAVAHLAARVGVGQSMYELADYTAANDVGTAVLLEALLDRPVERLLVASSMSIYGEGRYVDAAGSPHDEVERSRDVVRACRLALSADAAAGQAVNVGSGRSVTVRELAARLAGVLDVEVEPELTESFRAGDVRHCFADVSLARQLLGFEPEVSLGDGLADLAGWLEGQVAIDRTEQAARELAARGLAL